jgi:hypothetical protein
MPPTQAPPSHAAKLATLADGQRQVGKFAHAPTQPEAAKLLNISTRTVKSATAVRDKGIPALTHAVEQEANWHLDPPASRPVFITSSPILVASLISRAIVARWRPVR